MSAISVSGCSQSVSMPHQVVTALQLSLHSFLYVLKGVFSAEHTDCTVKQNPQIDQKLWGTLKARYVVLILEESYLPSECDATLGLAFLLEEQWEVTVFESVKTKGLLLHKIFQCGKEKKYKRKRGESLVTVALVSYSTEDWSSMARWVGTYSDQVTISLTNMIDVFNNHWLLFLLCPLGFVVIKI